MEMEKYVIKTNYQYRMNILIRQLNQGIIKTRKEKRKKQVMLLKPQNEINNKTVVN